MPPKPPISNATTRNDTRRSPSRSPAAKGRRRLRRCLRSASRSSRSLMMYVAEAHSPEAQERYRRAGQRRGVPGVRPAAAAQKSAYFSPTGAAGWPSTSSSVPPVRGRRTLPQPACCWRAAFVDASKRAVRVRHHAARHTGRQQLGNVGPSHCRCNKSFRRRKSFTERR